MAEITINLNAPLNQSVQTGDLAYYIKIANNTQGGFTISSSDSNMVKIGTIKSITLSDTNDDGVNDNAALLCDILTGTTEPEIGDFIFFAKDRGTNETSLLGYYGEFLYQNDSRENAELFMTSCEIVENS